MARLIRTLDLFCGGGGSSWGAEAAGATVVAAVDKWDLARDSYRDNFPKAHFFLANADKLRPSMVRKAVGRRIQLILASPECTAHTCARGNGTRSEKSRRTAFQVLKFVRSFKPRWVVVENVIHMRSWRRYEEWLTKIQRLGYHYREQVLNAADFGVPQSRKRLFVLFDRKKQPPEIRPSTKVRQKTVRNILHLNGRFPSVDLRTPKRAKPTLERAKRAMAEIGRHRSFLIVYYGTDGAGGWQTLDLPLRTVTTLDRFAYVRPVRGGHKMRMLQVPELKRAMGFPSIFKLNHGTRRDKIRLIGNAVCPQVVSAIVRQLLKVERNGRIDTKLFSNTDAKAPH
jgi:DNA (cytosine-5)-methyltransferase 1